MSELSPESRALLDAAREGMGPDVAAIARMRSKLDVAIAGGAATAVASSTGVSIAAKLGIVGLVVATITVGVLQLHRRPEPATLITLPAPMIDCFGHRSEPVREVAREAPPPAPPASEATSTLPRIEVPAPRRMTLAREVALIDRAMAALKAGDPRAALDAARAHRREAAGRGQLTEDAAAIEIEALCRLGEPADSKLEAFDARWPASVQRARLTTACQE